MAEQNADAARVSGAVDRLAAGLGIPPELLEAGPGGHYAQWLAPPDEVEGYVNPYPALFRDAVVNGKICVMTAPCDGDHGWTARPLKLPPHLVEQYAETLTPEQAARFVAFQRSLEA